MLSKDRALMIVEPLAADRLEDNLKPVGRMYYAFSTSISVPASLSQEVGATLRAQVGQTRPIELLREAGLSYGQCATEAPFNMLIEARA